MKLEEQCVSLELAKKLNELGVKQESLWSWANDYDTNYCLCLSDTRTAKFGSPYSAFTVAELGELLPKGWHSTKPWNDYEQKTKGKWGCILWGEVGETKEAFYAKTEADARAKMLIYLIENNLIGGSK